MMATINQIRAQKCGNCRFYDDYRKSSGFCRRYPPTVTMVADDQTGIDTWWPEVLEKAWCGEWREE